MEYDVKNHSKFLLLVHLIFVCKYRKELLIRFGNQIKEIFNDIATEKGFEIVEMEVEKTHIHLLAKYNPTKSIVEIVRWLKQISIFRIWRQFDNGTYLKRDFWKEKTFWSDGYFACSIGNVSRETIEKYIREQG